MNTLASGLRFGKNLEGQMWLGGKVLAPLIFEMIGKSTVFFPGLF